MKTTCLSNVTQQILDKIGSQIVDPPRLYVGASGIGRECLRAVWYGFKGYPQSPIPPKTLITFAIGKRLERMIINYIDDAGIPITATDIALQDIELPLFSGHADAMTWDAVIEIKTANSVSFAKFKNHGLKVWSPGYYAQLQSYMGMSGQPLGLMLALNKDTSDLHHEWVEFDEIFYHELRNRAKIVVESESPPKKYSESPMNFVCKRCFYIDECHFKENK